jgi:hypothetical protein
VIAFVCVFLIVLIHREPTRPHRITDTKKLDGSIKLTSCKLKAFPLVIANQRGPALRRRIITRKKFATLTCLLFHIVRHFVPPVGMRRALFYVRDCS